MLPFLLFFFFWQTECLQIVSPELTVDMGRHTTVFVSGAAPGSMLCAYVNMQQWGSHALAADDGTASIIVVFPNTGSFSVKVANACPNNTAFPVGQPIPAGAALSNALQINVAHRVIRRPIYDPNHIVGIDWEPWFTQHNSHFQTAEAIPLLGRYSSFDYNATRQHALWLVEAGVNVYYVDWTNNLWGKSSWAQRGVYAQEIINATVFALEVLADMKAKEDIQVPKFVLLTGLDNGPNAAPAAVNEQLAWVYDHLMTNDTLKDMFVIYDTKPLIVVFDGGDIHNKVTPPISHHNITLRYMNSQNQGSHLNLKGFWSWMDGTISPQATPFPNSTHKQGTEALTITNAFFAAGGWLKTGVPQLNGATYLTEFTYALKYNPAFLLICQWNEFTGTPAGHGTGPNHDGYYDSYNVTLNNDMEPTAMNVAGYRSYHGGWGYLWVNILRATIDYFHNPASFDSTLMVISYPGYGMQVAAGEVSIQWTAIGVPPKSGYDVSIDSKVIGHTDNTEYTVKLLPGTYSVSVVALGMVSRYPLSYDKVDTLFTKTRVAPAILFTVL